MVVWLGVLLVSLMLLSLARLLWARPSGAELQAGLVTIGATTLALVVAMAVSAGFAA